MKISVLGTGMVGQVIASKMGSMEHEVFMGTRNTAETKKRDSKNPISGGTFADWIKTNPQISICNFEDLPQDTELYINATNGGASLNALNTVGKQKLAGKIIMDIANPLDFSKGMPPSLFISNTDSLGETIQREFPESKVIKTLNTMNCNIMMDPSIIPGNHSVFVSGNDTQAKAIVENLLVSIGWEKSNILDLGDITTARGTEMMLPVWLRLWGAFGNAEFNFQIQKK